MRTSLAAAIAATIALLTAAGGSADPGDPAGWSVLQDPRKRAFLIYVPQAGGPRVLALACLADADTFTVISAGLARDMARGVSLRLANGSARYEVRGDVDLDLVTRELGFVRDMPADAKARAGIAAGLMPVLAGKGPIELTVAGRSTTLPTDGLAAPLATFRGVCFEGR